MDASLLCVPLMMERYAASFLLVSMCFFVSVISATALLHTCFYHGQNLGNVPLVRHHLELLHSFRRPVTLLLMMTEGEALAVRHLEHCQAHTNTACLDSTAPLTTPSLYQCRS